MFEWVGVNVSKGKNAVDPGLISGRLELRDGLELGNFVTRADIQSFSFDDSRIDFWDATFITKAGLWASVPSLNANSKKKNKISLSLLLDRAGATELFPNAKQKKKGQKVTLKLETASSKQKKIEDLFFAPLVPLGTDLWYWEMKTKSHFRLSGSGYWRLVPAAAIPEPSGLLLFLAGLAGAHAAHRRRGGARKRD